jgi:hypothetical protein
VSEPEVSRDPFAPLEVSPRGAHLLAGLALVAAVLTIVGALAPIAGPVGMVLGLLGHVKGSRLGLPAAVLAGIGMIIGFSIAFLLR